MPRGTRSGASVVATYVIQGLSGSQFLVEGGGTTLVAGVRFMVDPAWDYTTAHRTFTITDDDANLAGDNSADELGNDSGQTAVVTDASGATLYSGRVYAEASAVFTAPDGSTITLYVLEIGGVVVGEVTSAPLQPGVTYQVSSVPDVSTGPTYASLASMSFDPDLANVIQGGVYNDSLAAGAGNDSVNAGAGADTVDGGTGDDNIQFGTGGATQAAGDSVHGGDGNDLIDDYAGSSGYVFDDTLYGDAGNDTIWAGAGNDLIDGGADNDELIGEQGHDTLWGGTGNDLVFGGADNDQLHGGDGDDWLLGDEGNDTLWGDAGDDTLNGGTGDDVLYGGADADIFTFSGYWGADTVWGDSLGNDQDTISFSGADSPVSVTFTGSEDGTATSATGTVSFDNIEGVTGSAHADTINAGLDGSGLFLDGGAGNDSITGGSGDDFLNGGAGDDTLAGGTGTDEFYFADGSGTDLVIGGEDAGNGDADLLNIDVTGAINVVFTGSEVGTASDTAAGTSISFSEIEEILAGSGDDTLDARASGAAQVLDGYTGDDLIYGGSADDTLLGDEGNDTLAGGAGNDNITTGTGLDRIVLADGGGADFIADFDIAPNGALSTDQLDVSGLHDGANNPVNAWDVTVSDDGSGNAVLSFPGGESVTLLGVAPAAISGAQALHAIGIPCIAAGMRLATPRGLVPVEVLRPGDLVDTRDGPPLPVLWAGRRRVSGAEMRAEPKLLPVEIKAGRLGNAQPVRLSALHAVAVPEGPDGALVRAGHLAASGWGGARVLRGQMRHDKVQDYHHLLLPRHALIAVEGLWVESFWPSARGFALLEVTQRQEVICALPRLAAVLWGGQTAQKAYGAPALPVLPRRQIDRAACAKWSLRTCNRAHFDGFVTQSAAVGAALHNRRIDG